MNKKSQIFKIKKYDAVSYCVYNNLDEILETPKGENGAEIYFSPEKHFLVNQLWIITKFGKYYYITTNTMFEKCIDITDTFKIGSRAIIYAKHLGRNQLFKFKKISE